MTTLRWVFADVDTLETWTMPINPIEMTDPIGKPKELRHGFTSRGRASSFRTVSAPKEWSFGGNIRSQQHRDDLASWSERGKVQVTDHLGRTFEVMFTSFEATEKRYNPKTPHRFRYTMKALLLRRIA